MLFLLLTVACNNMTVNNETVSSESVSDETISDDVHLINKMTQEEITKTNKHSLTLLDEPENIDPVEAFNNEEHKVQIEFQTITKETLIDNIEKSKDCISEDKYIDLVNSISLIPEDYSKKEIAFFMVDGFYIYDAFPFANGYEGGPIQLTQSSFDENNQLVESEINCENPEEYYKWLKEELINNGKTEEIAELTVCKVKLCYESYLNGNYESLPEGSIDIDDQSIWDSQNDNKYSDFRDKWEYNKDSIEEIKDNTEEINIYDEELDVEFLVHVVLPPNYDKEKTYPVLFLTDGVYRFGNTPELRKLMENEKAKETILVTLGYNYNIDGTDEGVRMEYLVTKRDKLLDFVTDNLFPYLGENYNIDYSNSTLYGHSDGGVFAEYALFNSDKYENQPFGNYIIGSPAFWALYEDPDNLNLNGYESDYGYFERNRNTSLNKSVFLCGGSLEDPDYEDMYHGHSTTLEGLEVLKEKLEKHNVDTIYKLYESHHYQYIPEMLVDYLTDNY